MNSAGPPQPETDQPRHSHPSPSTDDRFADGTPDFLRLDASSDRDTFRRCFALIAEFQALRPSSEVPGEINDCAALLRYSYRNALRIHDAGWFREAQIAPPSELPSVEKYRYPHTPLGAALFRIRPGAFLAEDLKNGTFAEFADAYNSLVFAVFSLGMGKTNSGSAKKTSAFERIRMSVDCNEECAFRNGCSSRIVRPVPCAS